MSLLGDRRVEDQPLLGRLGRMEHGVLEHAACRPSGGGAPCGLSPPRATSWRFHALQNSGLDWRSAWISSSNDGSPRCRALSARNFATASRELLLPVGEHLAPRRVHEHQPQVVACGARDRVEVAEHARTRRGSRRGSPSAGRARMQGSVRGSRSAAGRVGETRSAGGLHGGASSPRPSRIRWVRSAGVSRSARASASSTSSDARTSRPCSSHVYQVAPTPASCATSSRRRPGVRRRPPLGQADVLGLDALAACGAGNPRAPRAGARRCAAVSRLRRRVISLGVMSTTRINPSLVPG